MSKFDEIKNDVGTRSKSLLGTVADIMESVNTRTIAMATDVSGFAIAQLRLPTQTKDLGDYRGRSKEAFGRFGGTIKGHGQELVSVVKAVPAQVKNAWSVEKAA